MAEVKPESKTKKIEELQKERQSVAVFFMREFPQGKNAIKTAFETFRNNINIIKARKNEKPEEKPQPQAELPKAEVKTETIASLSSRNNFFKPNERLNKPREQTTGGQSSYKSYVPNYNRQQGQGSRPPYNPNFKNNYTARPGTKPPFGAKPFGAKPYGPKPFGAKPAVKEELPAEMKVQKVRDFSGNKKGGSHDYDEKRTLNKRQQMKFGLLDGEIDIEGYGEMRMGSRKLKIRKAREEQEQVRTEITNVIITTDRISVKDLSEKLSKPVSEIIKKLMNLGLMMTINSVLDLDTAELVAADFGITIERKVKETAEEKMQFLIKEEDKSMLKARPPIITVMGHVDHGKTSLLDAIKQTNVVAGEFGGITQHIGAYTISYNNNKITFIDTPGHAAFTAMRKRGAKITDIAILVVAADDGIMPQTIESVKHIKEAKVPMIVAINKIDKPEANPQRIKQQLTEHNVVPEEWGGDTICVEISAKNRTNMDKLMDMILLQAEMQDLKANPNREASGYVLEANMDKAKGTTATLIVQNGTLKLGNMIVCGTSYGKIKAMIDDKGQSVKSATPGIAVKVIGLNEVPKAGDYFYVADEKMAKQLVLERATKIKENKIQSASTNLDDFILRADATKLKYVNIIIKADTMGSAEALSSSLKEIKNDEVKVRILEATAGNITSSDISMAESSGAKIIAFNTKTDSKIKAEAKVKKISISEFNIIYRVVEEIEKAVKALETPKFKDVSLGRAEVKVVFKLSSGIVAGSFVKQGKIRRGARARVIRGGEVLVETQIDGLKIVKEDIKEAGERFECGIHLANFNDYKEGDEIECYEQERIN